MNTSLVFWKLEFSIILFNGQHKLKTSLLDQISNIYHAIALLQCAAFQQYNPCSIHQILFSSTFGVNDIRICPFIHIIKSHKKYKLPIFQRLNILMILCSKLYFFLFLSHSKVDIWRMQYFLYQAVLNVGLNLKSSMHFKTIQIHEDKIILAVTPVFSASSHSSVMSTTILSSLWI